MATTKRQHARYAATEWMRKGRVESAPALAAPAPVDSAAPAPAAPPAKPESRKK